MLVVAIKAVAHLKANLYIQRASLNLKKWIVYLLKRLTLSFVDDKINEDK